MSNIFRMPFKTAFAGLIAMQSFNSIAADNLPPLPEAVTSFGAVTHNGWLYVFGGHKGERHDYSVEMVSGSFQRLRLNGGSKWESLPGGPPGQGLALVAHGEYLYRV